MADSPSPPPFSTPKRKRTSLPFSAPLNGQFSFAVSASVDPSAGVSPSNSSTAPASGSNSPRTKVAHHFRGLALRDHPRDHPSDGGGGAGAGATGDDADPGLAHDAAAADSMQVDEDESKMRKRTKTSPMPDPVTAAPPRHPGRPKQAETSETPAAGDGHQPSAADGPNHEAPRFVPMNSDDEHQQTRPNIAAPFVLDQALFTSSPKPSPARLSRALLPPASNRTLDALRAGGKARKRAGTPPLSTTTGKAGSNDSAGHPSGATDPPARPEIVDPVRAALTWHEDEITIYDPEDEDDDGVGINGIGFKPTPAIAHARTMKRRQQLAEYKKREEREARARRSLRRRGGSPEPKPVPQPGCAQPEPVDGAGRKVRFTETEPSVMIETV